MTTIEELRTYLNEEISKIKLQLTEASINMIYIYNEEYIKAKLNAYEDILSKLPESNKICGRDCGCMDNSECKFLNQLHEQEEEKEQPPPVWYSSDEIYSDLKRRRFSHEVAEELSKIWADDLQGAFKKGWEKSQQSKK